MTVESFVTLSAYLGVFIVSSLLACLYQNSLDKGELKSPPARHILRAAVVLPVALLIGFRGTDVGFDTASMLSTYYSDAYTLEYLLSSSHDPLALVTIKALYCLFDGNVTAFLFTYSFATLYFLAAAVDKWGHGAKMPFALMVYYLYFACIGMDQMKQMLAVSMVAYAVACLVNGERRSYFAMVTVAGLFHFSAFLGYAFYFFRVRESRHPVLVAALISACVVATLLSDQVFSQLGLIFGDGAYSDYFTGRYAEQASRMQATGLRFVLDVAPCLLPALFWRRMPTDVRALVLVSLVAVMPLRMLGYQSSFLYRMYYEVAIVIVFAYPMARTGLLLGGGRKASTAKSNCFTAVSLIALVLYFYVAFSTSHGVVPYTLFA